MSGFQLLSVSLEGFHLLDDTPIATSTIKRESMETNHHQTDQHKVQNQDIDFFFGEIRNYHQIGIGFLEFEITLKNSGIF